MVTCRIPGKPQGKGRPRFTMKGHAYTPERTVLYEKLIRDEYMRQCGINHGDTTPLVMDIMIHFTPPKAATKKMREDMLSWKLYPMKKPDGSNVLKAVEDALNNVAYRDDVQIVDLHVKKRYAEEDAVTFSIRGIDDEPT